MSAVSILVNRDGIKEVTLACQKCGETDFQLQQYSRAYRYLSLDTDGHTQVSHRRFIGDPDYGDSDDWESEDVEWQCTNCGHSVEMSSDLGVALDIYEDFVANYPTEEQLANKILVYTNQLLTKENA